MSPRSWLGQVDVEPLARRAVRESRERRLGQDTCWAGQFQPLANLPKDVNEALHVFEAGHFGYPSGQRVLVCAPRDDAPVAEAPMLLFRREGFVVGVEAGHHINGQEIL